MFYKDLSEINPEFSQSKMYEKDVKNLLLAASEADGEDQFIYIETNDPN